jgi:hypothetical protein
VLKKILTTTFLLGALLAGAVSPAFAASYDTSTCSAGVDCQRIDIPYNGVNKAYSDYIYVPSGSDIWYDFTSNSSNGMFSVKFWVENSYGSQVGTTMAAGPYGGNDYNYFPAPRDGYYRLVTECTDGSKERCGGYGSIWRY